MPSVSDCSTVSGYGTWQFLNSQGYSGSSLGYYVKGSVIGLIFTSPANSKCGDQFTTWKQGPEVGLCLYLDPDSPCTGSVYTKER